MKKAINNWHWISLFLAGFTLIIILLGHWNFTQTIILSLIVCLFLHFFEEFGFPGGFPYMGVKVLLGKDELDQSKWNANNLNSIFGNWGFLILVYILPLLLPNVHFLTLAAIIFSFLELFMHLIIFNVRTKSFYNPGLITAVFGMTPLAIIFFILNKEITFSWYEYVIALVWCIAVFLFCFRSPLYWNLGKKQGYTFTQQSAFGIEKQKVK